MVPKTAIVFAYRGSLGSERDAGSSATMPTDSKGHRMEIEAGCIAVDSSTQFFSSIVIDIETLEMSSEEGRSRKLGRP